MSRNLVVLTLIILAAAACRGEFGAPATDAPGLPTQTAGPSTPQASAPQDSAPPTPAPAVGSIPMCDDVPQISAPADSYRDSPIYVANEMPTERLRAWASGKPGFQDLWIDREHHGWVVLAFSVDAAARQEELKAEFPDVGAVTVQVDWTKSELEALQQRVVRELMPEVATSAGSGSAKGVVSIGVGILTPERIAAVEAKFAGERVCLEGIDPADAPVEGPQPQSGDGWRLIADEDETGSPYRTGIAFDDASYAGLWRTIGLAGDRPEVDFQSEVVIWFGAVHGSSCPRLRLDGVSVTKAIVHAEMTRFEIGACTADAIGHAYVVALERSSLPQGPFWIQLGADSPPAGVREERTIVEVDLSVPGSVAAPGEVHPDTSEPEPYFVGPGEFIENDYPFEYRQSVECGLEWLGPLNDVNWRTPAAAGEPDWIPAEWSDSVVDGQIKLEVLLTVDPPRLEATADRHSVIYEATADQPPGCD